ncbi:MAG TPA: ion transporter [Geminicoccaceae bacterium]|nr:ion transporter [Geminicoccaceae bacterium]
MAPPTSRDEAPTARERWRTLHQLEDWLETPMLVLSFVWLMLVLAELVIGTARILEVFGTAIWLVFIVEFALRLVLAPGKAAFVRRNWITLVALAVPALRMFRALRFLQLARAARGFRLVRIVGTANRTMNALRATMRRRGFGYALALTVLVTLLGAGGMLTFEPAREVEGGFTGFFDALWWTAMLMTTMGSDYWPQTTEGRLLCFLLSLYAFAVFGYITATFASFFIDRDTQERRAAAGPVAAALRAEIESLRVELRQHGGRDRG